MALETTTRKALRIGDGTTTVHAIPFKFFENADLKVYLIDVVTGVSTLQVEDTDYTVSGVGLSGTASVTFTSAPTSNDYVFFIRDTPILQENVLNDNETLAAEKAEETLDRLTMIAQELDELASRSVIQNPTETTSPTTDGDVGVTDVLLVEITGSPTGTDHPFTEQEPVAGDTTTQDLSGGRSGTLKFPDLCTTDKTNEVIFAVEMKDSAGTTVYRGWLPGD